MNNQNQPRISVIIPTRHRNDLLAKCLDCLAPSVQTLSPDQYEVIVTDDGSKSTAEQLVRDQYPWAKWIKGPCKGPAANRNHGANTAEGEWLAFTDDDCLPSPGWLDGYAKTLTDEVFVYEGKTTCNSGIQSPLYEAPINLTGGNLWSCNLVFQSRFFKLIQGFDPGYNFAMEDIDMRDRLLRQRHTIHFVPEAIVDHPPRRRASGLIIGERTEGYIRYWYKFGNRSSYWIPFLKHVKHRLYCLRRFPLSTDLIVAYFSLALEIVYVVFHLPRWQTHFRKVYAFDTQLGTSGQIP